MSVAKWFKRIVSQPTSPAVPAQQQAGASDQPVAQQQQSLPQPKPFDPAPVYAAMGSPNVG